MSRKIFRELVSVEAAKTRLYQAYSPQPLGVEDVPLPDCYGRVLGEDVVSAVDVPPFDRASMDGFAVRAEETFPAQEHTPIVLKVVGSVGAGESPNVGVSKGEAVEISTGAAVPHGANAVVMVEYTWREGDQLKVFRPVGVGENIMGAGADIMMGETVLRKATPLTPRETGVLAAVGVEKVACFRKPRVAVFSTGNEIVPPGGPLRYGKIYDVNSRSVADAVREAGGEPVFMGIVEDDLAALRGKIKEAFSIADVVIASGGTSAGVGDLLYHVLDGLGKPGVLVHGVAVKPGKPTIIGVVEGKPFFGLPGYPASALIIFSLFVKPVLRAMAGLRGGGEEVGVEARLAEKIYASEGRRDYVLVNLTLTETGDYNAYPLHAESGAIGTLAWADGFVEVGEERVFVEAGERVRVELFSGEVKPADLTIIGSHCLGVDLLRTLLREGHPEARVKSVNVGSSGGLAALRRGEADVAGVHLLNEKTGEYNIPFLAKHGVADKTTLVRGYVRKQVLLVRRGNPKGVRGVEDLLREGVVLINRNPGSGTRVLLDYHLKRIAQEKRVGFEELTSKIQGYGIEAKSHSAVATAILHGRADVGLGIETAAVKSDLDFIPLTDEHYDFAFRAERLKKPLVAAFLEALRSDAFKKELTTSYPGLIPTKETGKILYSP